MRTIRIKDKEYNVSSAWAPLIDGSCGIVLLDKMPISQIETEFSGANEIHFHDPITGDAVFRGYTVLDSIHENIIPDAIYIRLRKPSDEELKDVAT